MASVTLRQVTKRYPGVEEDTVKTTDLNIGDKEFMILVGPSGCGKSTTLRMIAGLEEITTGDISIGNTIVNDLPPKERDIAMVFQNYALYPHMNVYENLAFGLRLRGETRQGIDKKVRNAADILGLDELLDRKPKQMSGGQRQRVALGRAIVRNPQVFLMDEPLSNLDAKLRVQMRAEINKLHKRLQTTIIYVTHDQTEAMTMGDRICVLNDGYVQQCDTPQVVYDSPANKFVAGFIGSPSMNFATCRFEKGILKGDGLSLKLPQKMLKGLMKWEGVEVVLGIRPEDIYSTDTAPFKVNDGENTFNSIIDVTEPMGAENFFYLSITDKEGKKVAPNEAKSIVARLAPSVAGHYGEKFTAVVDLKKIHLFESTLEGKTII